MNKRIQKTIAWLSVCISFLSQCQMLKEEEKDNTKEILAVGILAATSTPYTEVVPKSGTIALSNLPSGSRTYNPSCTGVSGNTNFKFYLKRGSTKNLLINFMGGGGCWDGKNCFGSSTTTYYNRLDQFSGLAVRVAFQGILEERDARNPFKDWNVLFIPYCSGDLHWGSNEVTYQDPTNGNANTSFKHRGFDNFLAALDSTLQNSDFLPDSSSKIFVTGQSAGAYGAIFNFPYIVSGYRAKVTNLPESNFFLLGDAGNGVVPSGYQNDSIVGKWAANNNVPTNLTGITNFSTLEFGTLVNEVALRYPSARIGQYSTYYDGTQIFFYNLQVEIKGGKAYENSTSMWGPSDGTSVAQTRACEWVSSTANPVGWKNQWNIPTGRSNYRSYVASGDIHTISTSSRFYTEASGGKSLLEWYNDMLGGGTWASSSCFSSGEPNCRTSTQKISATCP